MLLSRFLNHSINLLADPHYAIGFVHDGLDLVALSCDFSGLVLELSAEIVNLIISVEMLMGLVLGLTLLKDGIELGAESVSNFGSGRKLGLRSSGRGISAHAAVADIECLLRFGFLSISEMTSAEFDVHWLVVADIVNHFSVYFGFISDK